MKSTVPGSAFPGCVVAGVFNARQHGVRLEANCYPAFPECVAYVRSNCFYPLKSKRPKTIFFMQCAIVLFMHLQTYRIVGDHEYAIYFNVTIWKHGQTIGSIIDLLEV